MVRREAYTQLLKGYPESDKINAVSEGAEILYVRLLAQSDDLGRYWGAPDWILAKLFTARMVAGQVSKKEIERRLEELVSVGLIQRYTVADVLYLQITKLFRRHRNDVSRYVQFPEQVTASVTDMGRERDANGTLEPRTKNKNQEQDTSASAEVCGEPASPASPPALEFPCVGKGSKVWILTEEKLAEYRDSFPGIDVLATCRIARQWCVDNPAKRKTPDGMLRFLSRWLGKAQNEAGRSPSNSNQGRSGKNFTAPKVGR